MNRYLADGFAALSERLGEEAGLSHPACGWDGSGYLCRWSSVYQRPEGLDLLGRLSLRLDPEIDESGGVSEGRMRLSALLWDPSGGIATWSRGFWSRMLSPQEVSSIQDFARVPHPDELRGPFPARTWQSLVVAIRNGREQLEVAASEGVERESRDSAIGRFKRELYDGAAGESSNQPAIENPRSGLYTVAPSGLAIERLTPRQRELLRVLLEWFPSWVSTGELAETLGASSPDQIYNLVRRTRLALARAEPAGNQLIRSKRGFGYRIAGLRASAG